MRYELLYQPSYTVAKVSLELGESIRAESGAMVSMSPGVDVQSKGQGGLGKMLGRMVAGESAFQTTFTATQGPGEVLLAPSGPGDIAEIPMGGPAMMVTSGCYLAGDTSLEMQTQARAKAFFSGEGLFLLRVAGHGQLLVSAFGAIHRIDLGPGEAYVVDTGHLVAFTEGMGYDLKRAAKSLLGSLTSGEMMVAQMTGPGSVYIQTRNPAAFGGWLGQYVTRSG